MKRFYKFKLIRFILRLLESFLSFCSNDILLREEKDRNNKSENSLSHEKEEINHDSNSSKP